MTSGKEPVTVVSKAGAFMTKAIADYITMLKGRLGQSVPEMHPSLRFQRKILVTYVEACEFLRKGQPLLDDERAELQDCVLHWERLLAKMKEHWDLYGEYRLWMEGAVQRKSEKPDALLFSENDLFCMNAALDEYLVACSLVDKRADFTEDESAELGNDLPLYNYAHMAVSEAWRCLWEESHPGRTAPS